MSSSCHQHRKYVFRTPEEFQRDWLKDNCDGNDDTGNDNRIGRSLPPCRSVIIDPLNCHAAVDCLWHWKRFGHDIPMTIAIGILPTAKLSKCWPVTTKNCHGHLPACRCQNNFGLSMLNCHIAACQRQNVMTDCHVVSTLI